MKTGGLGEGKEGADAYWARMRELQTEACSPFRRI